MKFEGKTALITGAGSGIGAATAKRFAADGAAVVITDVNEQGLNEVAAALPEGAVSVCPGDITKPGDVERMAAVALALGSGLDILVNCAAIDPPDRETDTAKALDIWHKIMEVNLTGAYLLMRTIIPHIVRQGGGAVVNISSLSGIRFIPGKPSYPASKGGLIALTQMAAVQYGPDNVRCNVVCPGPVRTPLFVGNTKPFADMVGKDLEEVFEAFTALSPMHRMGESADVAKAVLFLASDDGEWVTGQEFVVDGGFEAGGGGVAREDDRLMPARGELTNDRCSQIAGAARHEYAHASK